MQLSQPQQDAVDHTGSPALVVAGAGSGKTRTLTAKFSHLITTGHAPERILAITFTNKAAQEMKTRLMEMTGLHQMRFEWVRTYHSACLMILKQHCQIMGYTPPLQVFSVYQQDKLIKELCVKNNIDKKYARRILSSISRAKNDGDPAKYFDRKPGFLNIRMADIFAQFEERLAEMNCVDFDNILLKTRDLLRDNADVRNFYRNLFSYILVDEYQDTNNLQEELTSLLLGEHRNLFCVGDDWQAVYGFRGSNVNHFLYGLHKNIKMQKFSGWRKITGQPTKLSRQPMISLTTTRTKWRNAVFHKKKAGCWRSMNSCLIPMKPNGLPGVSLIFTNRDRAFPLTGWPWSTGPNFAPCPLKKFSEGFAFLTVSWAPRAFLNVWKCWTSTPI